MFTRSASDRPRVDLSTFLDTIRDARDQSDRPPCSLHDRHRRSLQLRPRPDEDHEIGLTLRIDITVISGCSDKLSGCHHQYLSPAYARGF
jgi:hypothetical protein